MNKDNIQPIGTGFGISVITDIQNDGDNLIVGRGTLLFDAEGRLVERSKHTEYEMIRTKTTKKPERIYKGKNEN